jgi:hypothetical protein
LKATGVAAKYHRRLVRDVEKRTTDISARAEWIDRWMEKIARAVRLGSKDSGEVGEAREREREREKGWRFVSFGFKECFNQFD